MPLKELCELFGVSRSWYYEKPSSQQKASEEVELRDAIERIVLEFPGYGYRRVAEALRRQGWCINHKKVLRVMRKEALLCQLKKRFRPTTDSAHSFGIYQTSSRTLLSTDPIRDGLRTSPTSGCQPPSATWLQSSTTIAPTAWAGPSVGG
jgi:putative transposase